MTNPPPTPAERFASILRGLTQAVVTRSAFGLPQQLIVLIFTRIREINQRAARIFARLRAGTYAPRRFAPRAPGVRSLRPNPLPQTRGWLLKLVPEAIGFGSQLEYLLRDPEMAALLAAAPVSLGRPLRSLCRMLRVDPPPILALPAKPQPPRPKPPRTAAETPPPNPPPSPPRPPRRRRWSLARICGPPHPA